MRALPTGILLALTAVAACSSDAGSGAFKGVPDSPPKGGAAGGGGKARGGAAGQAAKICAPGASQACTCNPGSQSGLETCAADGTRYGNCVCSSGGAGGAGGAAKGGSAGKAGTSGGGVAAGAGGTAEGGDGGAPAGGEGGGAGKDPFDNGDAGAAGAGTTGCVAGALDEDVDKDGFTPNQGDCNDCNPVINPGAIERANDQADNDCDGVVDNVPAACDAGLGAKVGDPANAARAIGICNIGVPANPPDPKDRKWGLIKASFSGIAGQFLEAPPAEGASIDEQLGIVPGFGSGTSAQEGSNVFALSTGLARAPGQPDGGDQICDVPRTHSGPSLYPPGFPKKGNCGKTGAAYDGIGLDMSIRVPTNAKAFKVKLKFFTCEYPMFTCQQYNDVFALLMTPSPLMAGDVMADADNASANVAFETTMGGKNVIGVNNTSFLTACQTSGFTPEYKNCGGEGGLAGSGFDGHAASSWLQSTVPIPAFPPGADRIIRLRFAIWDSGDAALDSTVVVDAFEWETEATGDTATRIEN